MLGLMRRNRRPTPLRHLVSLLHRELPTLPAGPFAINRLRITFAIEYIDHKEEKKNWKQNFQFFFDYPTTTDLASIQSQAHEAILRQVMEDIFNKTFTDW